MTVYQFMFWYMTIVEALVRVLRWMVYGLLAVGAAMIVTLVAVAVIRKCGG